jgi:sodium-dependent dicarboxylate transporter 2/3/5
VNKVKLTGFIIGPILFVVVYFALKQTTLNPEACKVLAVAAWMVSWWVTEAVHVSITALIPMVLLPMMGIITIKDATASY